MLCFKASTSLSCGSGAASPPGRVGSAAHLLCWHVQHHRWVRHCHLEWGAPQDGVWLQSYGPRLPGPRTPGQRIGGAEGSGHHWGGVPTERLSPRTRTPEMLKEPSDVEMCPWVGGYRSSRTSRTWTTKEVMHTDNRTLEGERGKALETNC